MSLRTVSITINVYNFCGHHKISLSQLYNFLSTKLLLPTNICTEKYSIANI